MEEKKNTSKLIGNASKLFTKVIKTAFVQQFQRNH